MTDGQLRRWYAPGIMHDIEVTRKTTGCSKMKELLYYRFAGCKNREHYTLLRESGKMTWLVFMCLLMQVFCLGVPSPPDSPPKLPSPNDNMVNFIILDVLGTLLLLAFIISCLLALYCNRRREPMAPKK